MVREKWWHWVVAQRQRRLGCGTGAPDTADGDGLLPTPDLGEDQLGWAAILGRQPFLRLLVGIEKLSAKLSNNCYVSFLQPFPSPTPAPFYFLQEKIQQPLKQKTGRTVCGFSWA